MDGRIPRTRVNFFFNEKKNMTKEERSSVNKVDRCGKSALRPRDSSRLGTGSLKKTGSLTQNASSASRTDRREMEANKAT
jgi:hypothetical protein